MALVSPLDEVEGGVDDLVLEAVVGLGTSYKGNGSYNGPQDHWRKVTPGA
jgi:hexosaminidase